MRVLFQPEPWQDDAVCRQTDPDKWFSKQPADVRTAQQICWACPVITECLAYSLRNREPYGVWGGVSEKERRKILARTGSPETSTCTPLWHMANPQEPCPKCKQQQAA